MKNLSKIQIRKLILQELESIGEDVLVKSVTSNSTPPLKHYAGKKCRNCQSNIDMCECGSMYEEECSESEETLNENCGCQESNNDMDKSIWQKIVKKDPDVNSIDYHGILRDILGMHTTNNKHMKSSHTKKGQKHSGAYMSKSQLFKIQRYSKKLYDLIPEGHNLEDWMRTKISQISDDISEVYHALDHDSFKGEL